MEVTETRAEGLIQISMKNKGVKNRILKKNSTEIVRETVHFLLQCQVHQGTRIHPPFRKVTDNQQSSSAPVAIFWFILLTKSAAYQR